MGCDCSPYGGETEARRQCTLYGWLEGGEHEGTRALVYMQMSSQRLGSR